jgi:hypothetical protein
MPNLQGQEGSKAIPIQKGGQVTTYSIILVTFIPTQQLTFY